MRLVALVAVEALPLKVAVIVPAEKLPDESRATMALAVLVLDAVVFALGRMPETSDVARSTAFEVEPVPTRLVALVAVEALPLKVAVIVPAEKLPDESRATIALAVLALAAVVWLFASTPLTSAVAKSTAPVREPEPTRLEALGAVLLNESVDTLETGAEAVIICPSVGWVFGSR